MKKMVEKSIKTWEIDENERLFSYPLIPPHTTSVLRFFELEHPLSYYWYEVEDDDDEDDDDKEV